VGVTTFRTFDLTGSVGLPTIPTQTTELQKSDAG
jgi:hypothetical protein